MKLFVIAHGEYCGTTDEAYIHYVVDSEEKAKAICNSHEGWVYFAIELNSSIDSNERII